MLTSLVSLTLFPCDGYCPWTQKNTDNVVRAPSPIIHRDNY